MADVVSPSTHGVAFDESIAVARHLLVGIHAYSLPESCESIDGVTCFSLSPADSQFATSWRAGSGLVALGAVAAPAKPAPVATSATVASSATQADRRRACSRRGAVNDVPAAYARPRQGATAAMLPSDPAERSSPPALGAVRSGPVS